MKSHFFKLLCASLAALMLATSFASCAETDDGTPDKESTAVTSADSGESDEAESETSAIDGALSEIGEVDYGNKKFTILHQDTFKSEVFGENKILGDSDGGNSQVINDAVYTRNRTIEERCKLKLSFIEQDYPTLIQTVRNETAAPMREFQLIDTYIFQNAALAVENCLSGMKQMDVDLEGEWWDKGTADFSLKGDTYFMCGSLNTGDDQVTYVLIFNKQMQKDLQVANPYEVVRKKEWTLDYFHNVIQGISHNSNGDGTWDEKDTYGFVTTWEYGTTFFHGCDLRYILNDPEAKTPTLFLAEESRMEKAVNVVDMAKQIYHNNHATYMSPPGQENLGTTAFKENRALFFGDTCLYLGVFNSTMDGDYGVLPIPKYDKAQENYRTWTHASGSSFSVPTTVLDAELQVIGDIFETWAILSHQYLKPAYYDTVLTSRNVQDADSTEMLDILFQNRVYDMAFYFDLGLSELVKNDVNDNAGKFSSAYKRISSRFDSKLENLMSKLEERE